MFGRLEMIHLAKVRSGHPFGSGHSFLRLIADTASLTALATILQIGIGAILYSSCLSFYFVLTIRFGMREATFAKRIEKAMHFLVITFSLGTSVTGLVTDMYYPMHVGPGEHRFQRCNLAQPFICSP